MTGRDWGRPGRKRERSTQRLGQLRSQRLWPGERSENSAHGVHGAILKEPQAEALAGEIKLKNLRTHAARVAVGAVHLRQIADIDGVLEGWDSVCSEATCAAAFREHRMALVAFPADDFAVGADMLAVVAAEASVEIEVSEIVGMCLPVQLHLRECGALEDLLHFRYSCCGFLTASPWLRRDTSLS